MKTIIQYHNYTSTDLFSIWLFTIFQETIKLNFSVCTIHSHPLVFLKQITVRFSIFLKTYKPYFRTEIAGLWSFFDSPWIVYSKFCVSKIRSSYLMLRHKLLQTRSPLVFLYSLIFTLMTCRTLRQNQSINTIISATRCRRTITCLWFTGTSCCFHIVNIGSYFSIVPRWYNITSRQLRVCMLPP